MFPLPNALVRRRFAVSDYKIPSAGALSIDVDLATVITHIPFRCEIEREGKRIGSLPSENLGTGSSARLSG